MGDLQNPGGKFPVGWQGRDSCWLRQLSGTQAASCLLTRHLRSADNFTLLLPTYLHMGCSPRAAEVGSSVVTVFSRALARAVRPTLTVLDRTLAGLGPHFGLFSALWLVCIVLLRCFCAFCLGHRPWPKGQALLTRQNGAETTQKHYAAPPKWRK